MEQQRAKVSAKVDLPEPEQPIIEIFIVSPHIEATKKAVDENKAIYRKSLPHIKFVPTNSKNAAFILFSDDNDRPAGRMWNPMAKDILSNDWEVLN